MITEGMVKSTASLGLNVVKGIGNATYDFANTKLGGTALAAGTGLFLARKFFDRNKDKISNTKNKEFKWMKKKPHLYEQNLNLPRFPVPPNLTKSIPKNPRSIVGTLDGVQNKYRQRAEIDHVELQRKQAQMNMKKAKANTGYDKQLGKISTV